MLRCNSWGSKYKHLQLFCFCPINLKRSLLKPTTPLAGFSGILQLILNMKDVYEFLKTIKFGAREEVSPTTVNMQTGDDNVSKHANH